MPCALHFWCARGVRERAICKPLWRSAVDSIASLCSCSQALHNGAFESSVRWRGGSRIAH
eukprot:3641251-Lingulodinium_polyedra.AAC.1